MPQGYANSFFSTLLGEETFLGTYEKSMPGIADDFWPLKRFACTAVDVSSGEFKVWEAGGGASLRRAVASSSAVPGLYPPVEIAGHRYMDGGMRSGTNADLAEGYEVVVVIALSSGAAPEIFRRPLLRELQLLRDSGSEVVLITPDAQSFVSFGPNLMDPGRRPVAAAAGLRQGELGCPELAGIW